MVAQDMATLRYAKKQTISLIDGITKDRLVKD